MKSSTLIASFLLSASFSLATAPHPHHRVVKVKRDGLGASFVSSATNIDATAANSILRDAATSNAATATASGTSKAVTITAKTNAKATTPPKGGGIGASFISTNVKVPVSEVTVHPPSGAVIAGDNTKTSSAVSSKATKAVKGDASVSAEASQTTSRNAASSAAAAISTQASAGAASAGNAVDLVVLQLALVLEQLETKFYSDALAKFPVDKMVEAGLTKAQASIIAQQLQTIQTDESTHVDVLTGAIKALGAEPLNKCGFNIEAALTDVPTLLAVARAVEAVGVSAYLGAANLLSDNALLTAAGSILTLESRHQSLLNTFNQGSFASQPFDIPLAAADILSLAGGFLSGCIAADLSLTTNQPLSITDAKTKSTTFQVGSQLEFTSTVDLAKAGDLFCQMIVGGAPTAIVLPADKCVIPKVNGIVAVSLTNSSEPLASNILIQAQGSRVTGTGFIFVDSVQEDLGALFAIQGAGGDAAGNKGAKASANLGAYYMNQMPGQQKQEIIIQSQETTGIDDAQKSITESGTVIRRSAGTDREQKNRSRQQPGPQRLRRHTREPQADLDPPIVERGWSVRYL